MFSDFSASRKPTTTKVQQVSFTRRDCIGCTSRGKTNTGSFLPFICGGQSNFYLALSIVNNKSKLSKTVNICTKIARQKQTRAHTALRLLKADQSSVMFCIFPVVNMSYHQQDGGSNSTSFWCQEITFTF